MSSRFVIWSPVTSSVFNGELAGQLQTRQARWYVVSISARLKPLIFIEHLLEAKVNIVYQMYNILLRRWCFESLPTSILFLQRSLFHA